MKKQIIAVLSAFAIFTTSFVSMSMEVSATASTEESSTSESNEDDPIITGGSGGGRSFSGWNSWTLAEKFNYWVNVAFEGSMGTIGFFSPTDDTSVIELHQQFLEDEVNKQGLTYEEWVTTRMSVQENPTTGELELLLDDELVDSVKSACDTYVDSATGYYLLPTYTLSDLPASEFKSASLYKWALEFLEQHLTESGDVFFSQTYPTTQSDSSGSTINVWSGLLCDESDGFSYVFYDNKNSVKYYDTDVQSPIDTDGYRGMGFLIYDSDWQKVNRYTTTYTFTLENKTLINTAYWENLQAWNFNNEIYGVSGSGCKAPFTMDGHSLRLFKSEEAMKNFSVGNLPYYTSSAFGSYNTAGDNSCVLTESQLANSSLYGDVQNYIVENGVSNSISEEALIQIVDMLLNAQVNGGSGSSDSGSSSSGTGLSGFLDGLSGLGDGILSIFGKLLEYIGKALELITTTIDDILTVIPTNITNILTALFPFIPEEWITAITLSLVLAVVYGIVKLIRG